MSLIRQAQTAGADQELRYPKIMLYGAPGVAKTVTALFIAKTLGIKCIALDGDAGAEAYLSDPDWAGCFAATVSSDPVEVCRAMDDLLLDPQGYSLLLIDSVSSMWRAGEYGVDAAARRNNPKKVNLSEYESAWDLSLWNPTKRLAWQIANNIKRLKMAIICTARESNKWSEGRVVGIKPEGDQQIGHEFDIVARLSQYAPNSPRVAEVEKDRLHRLPLRVEGAPDNPFFFATALLEAYGPEFRMTATANPRCSNEQVEKLYHLQGTILSTHPEVKHAQLLDWVRQAFQADTYEDLSPDQASSAISTLTARLGQEPSQ